MNQTSLETLKDSVKQTVSSDIGSIFKSRFPPICQNVASKYFLSHNIFTNSNKAVNYRVPLSTSTVDLSAIPSVVFYVNNLKRIVDN